MLVRLASESLSLMINKACRLQKLRGEVQNPQCTVLSMVDHTRASHISQYNYTNIVAATVEFFTLRQGQSQQTFVIFLYWAPALNLVNFSRYIISLRMSSRRCCCFNSDRCADIQKRLKAAGAPNMLVARESIFFWSSL